MNYIDLIKNCDEVQGSFLGRFKCIFLACVSGKNIGAFSKNLLKQPAKENLEYDIESIRLLQLRY